MSMCVARDVEVRLCLIGAAAEYAHLQNLVTQGFQYAAHHGFPLGARTRFENASDEEEELESKKLQNDLPSCAAQRVNKFMPRVRRK